MNERKHFIDNIRWMTVLLVIVYHIIYLFNCSGVVSNIGVQGIPQLDTILVFVYPWLMCLLFLVAGISSRYSLQKRTNKEFLKDRAKRILIPSIVAMFAFGWITGWVTNQYVDMFAGVDVPGVVQYFIFSTMGTGPLWFLHVLFIACVLLVIFRKIDKKDKLCNICKKVNWPILIGLVLVIWGSSFILNAPMITVYRFGIYLLMFFLGYYVFSHDEILEKVKKVSIPLGILSVVLGIIYTFIYYGTNYTLDACLQSIFTNVYLWCAILAILGLGQKFLNFNNKFTEYMTKNNFNYYILHYTVLVGLGYLVVTYLKLPFALNYILILLGTIIVLPLLIEIVKRIPIIRNLVLGIYKKKDKTIV